MTKLQELIAQKEALEQQIVEIRKQERTLVIRQVKEAIAWHELTKEELFGKGSVSTGRTSKVEAKYRDPETGNEWSGRGLAPKWIQNKDKSLFLIV